MAGDIEAFLKLAAERRRQAQGGQPPAAAQPAAPQSASPQAPSRPTPAAERRPLESSLKPSVRDSEIVDAVLDENTPYSPPSSVTQVSRPQKQRSKQQAKPKVPAPTNVPVLKPTVAPTVPTQTANYNKGSMNPTESSRDADAALANRVIQMFKSPASISSAIVLSEILKPLDLDRED
jgi:hypothetical protein